MYKFLVDKMSYVMLRSNLARSSAPPEQTPADPILACDAKHANSWAQALAAKFVPLETQTRTRSITLQADAQCRISLTSAANFRNSSKIFTSISGRSGSGPQRLQGAESNEPNDHDPLQTRGSWWQTLGRTTLFDISVVMYTSCSRHTNMNNSAPDGTHQQLKIRLRLVMENCLALLQRLVQSTLPHCGPSTNGAQTTSGHMPLKL